MPVCDDITVERTADLVLIAQPLSAGYGFPAALLMSGLPRLLDDVEAWVARAGGIPAAAAVVISHRGDAGVFMVATAPDLRGRGAAGAVVHHMLPRARDEGCIDLDLQSRAMGLSVYARIGYAQLAAYQLWEQRGLDQAPSDKSEAPWMIHKSAGGVALAFAQRGVSI